MQTHPTEPQTEPDDSRDPGFSRADMLDLLASAVEPHGLPMEWMFDRQDTDRRSGK